MLPGMFNPMVGLQAGARATFIGQKIEANGGATISGSVIVPRPGLVVGLYLGLGNQNRTFVGGTLAGVAATAILGNAVAALPKYGIFSRDLVAGTHAFDATISGINDSGPSGAHGVGLWLIEGLASPAHGDAQVNPNSSVASKSLVLNIPAVALYGALVGPEKAIDWSGATEEFEGTTGNNRMFAFATKAVPSIGNSETITIASASTNVALIGASW